MSPKRTSLQMFRLKRAVETLSRKEGRGTELVSLYVPPGRQVSEVLAMLRQEYGTAGNIKSDTTRKNVQDAITKVSQRLKLFREVPGNGLVLFSGAIPQDGIGSERMETYVLEPPEPINIYLYRCDARFHTEHLEEFLREREAYGILVMDTKAATFALLRGSSLRIVREITSGIPGKHRAGGQSAARFQRLREARVLEFYKRVGRHANEIFMEEPDLKGVIIGGSGPTKQDFQKGEHLHYTLKERVLATVDTAYTGEQGVEEVVEKAPEILRHLRYVEEKRIVQEFLYHVGHDTGLATYGEEEVRRSLERGAVRTLLLSEGLDVVRATVQCTACGYSARETVKRRGLDDLQRGLIGKPCPGCTAPSLQLAEAKEVIDDLADMAEQAGSDVEVISTETEEGVMLRDSFGGVAAVLRFKPSG